MAKILKTGTPVTVKDNNQPGIISSIDNGVYMLQGSKLKYSAGDLVAVKEEKKIPRVAEKTKKLNAIYSILSSQFKHNHKTCRARFAGCTHQATQVHHQYKRTGFYKIMSAYFFPICAKCHDYANIHSAEAIAAGVSISRYKTIPYRFSTHELNLMKQNNLNPPI